LADPASLRLSHERVDHAAVARDRRLPRAARIDYLFGCASFRVSIPTRSRRSWRCSTIAHRSHLAVRAWPELHVPMARVAPEALEERVAWRRLPPLVRAIFRRARRRRRAYVDHQFGTVDVFMLVATAAIRDAIAPASRLSSDAVRCPRAGASKP
jgi:putative hemolysin